MKKISRVNAGKLKYDKDGLIPAIIQDHKTGEVLMLAYMNKDSLRKTLKIKKTCFWSRSRKQYWIKGETSGNFQVVKTVYYDCDMDTLLIKVRQLGDGVACHTGNRSCFYRKI
jgi:phosphoribosyl-AMP cyclohydrolase